MVELYGHVVELFVDNTRFSGDEFTITFSVPFDDGGEPNVAEVKIFNLKDDTINRIKGDSRIILNAGYTGDAGAILVGTIKDVRTSWQDVDKITIMQVLDGTDGWASTPIKRTYKAGSTGEVILKDLSKLTGLQIGAFSLPMNHVYKSGKTINGTLSAVIKQVATDCGAKAHVTRGKVFIRPKNEGDNIGFVLDSAHGLVASPTPIEKEQKTKKEKTTKIQQQLERYENEGKKVEQPKIKRKGWAVKCLLNHRITTDAIIQISSRTANGTFRVESGRHSGDSFETEMEVFPV